MSDRLLLSDETAALLNTNPNTLAYWVHTGYGPRSAKIGRRRVWRESEVLAWVDAQFETAG